LSACPRCPVSTDAVQNVRRSTHLANTAAHNPMQEQLTGPHFALPALRTSSGDCRLGLPQIFQAHNRRRLLDCLEVSSHHTHAAGQVNALHLTEIWRYHRVSFGLHSGGHAVERCPVSPAPTGAVQNVRHSTLLADTAAHHPMHVPSSCMFREQLSAAHFALPLLHSRRQVIVGEGSHTFSRHTRNVHFWMF